VLSSHLVADIERVCDYLIVLAAARVQAAGEVQDLLAAHYLITRSSATASILPAGWQVICSSSAGRQVTMLIRADGPVDDRAWSISPPGLEDLVLAYMSRAADAAGHPHALEAQR
jgi:ABC-2 type transport system ATP-binding protein